MGTLMSRRARLCVLAVVAGGIACAGTPASAGTAPGSARALRGASCLRTDAGPLSDCHEQVPSSREPAGARDQRRLGTAPAPSSLAQLVDTRTWTTGGGNTFPGADVPFGMVQWSPDTMPSDNAGGGYSYTDTSLWGYSLTHVSGPGCGAAGDVPMLPYTGSLPTGDPNQVTTEFSHTGEIAQAGYYSAQSNAPNTITSEFTATSHSALGRFTYPATTSAGFLIKLMASQNGDSADTATVIGHNEVAGSDTTGGFCGESVNDHQPQVYTVHFDIVFDHPFTASQVITNSAQTDPAAVALTFDTTNDQVIQAKVGISYVSVENARLDRQSEDPGWDFTAVRTAAQQRWDDLLGRVEVSGGSVAQTQEFYSLLYKDFLQPNVTSDVNGQFMGADFKVHTLAPGQHDQYGMYSGWDIYHSLSQLQAMLDPAPTGDMVQSQLNYYSEDRVLQQWGYLQDNNYVMVGDPMQAIIADIYAFGGRNFNTAQALHDMLAQATTVNQVRPGEALEQQYGYLPEDGTYRCCNPHGFVPTLLEYDTQDLALAHFAQDLGDVSAAAMLERRANNWENVFDPATNLLTPRFLNGQFEAGVTPTDSAPYVEGDAYEYLWNVPNDYPALFSLLGGPAAVRPMLENYLSQPNGYGMYGQITNEFDEGEQFAPDYAQDPAAAQRAANTIRNTIYLPGPSGLANNDDLGAESSQFIWEMLGLYPENPGSRTLLLTTPGFPHAVLHLPNGHAVTIDAPGASPSTYYAQSLRLNGQPESRLSVDYGTLAAGASLDWTLGDHPSAWGTAPQDAPPADAAGLRPAVGYLSDQQVIIAPGGQATISVGAQNATGTAQTVSASASVPAATGLSVSPATGTLHLPANGRDTMTLTISASSTAAPTFRWVLVRLSMAGGTTQTLKLSVLVAQPGSLLAAFDNAGISNDSDVTVGNFDGGGASYSAQALAAAGLAPGKTVTVNGIPFTWPPSEPGRPDNVVAAGQRITVSAPAGTQTLGFLGAATNGPSQGVLTEHYSDGTSAQYWLGLSDWTLNGGSSKPSYGNTTAASMSYRNCSYCTPPQQQVGVYVFETALPVDPSKTLTSVTLPSGATQGELHLFALGTSTQALAPPVALGASPATAAPGQQVTITGTGFGASQGSGYVELTENGQGWGGPGQTPLTIDSWSDTAVTVTLPSTGLYPGEAASLTVVTAGGQSSDSPAIEIAPSSNLASYDDNTGISPDSNTACANLDGVGYSLSANALAAAGVTPGATVSADGLSFTWQNVPPCSPDNILASGQTILLSGPAGATKLGLLENSTDGGTTGTVTINYTDGTSSTATVNSSDWAAGPGPGEVAAVTTPYRNMVSGGSQQLTVYVYATTVPVNPAKTVASITLPTVSNSVSGGTTSMHIYALSLG
jgi:predicted alpha-1,2-mannosidase